MQIETKKQIANLTSNILNPFLVSMAIILLLSFASTSSTFDALKWALISVAVSILPVFSFIVYLVQTGRLDAFFAIVREQRTKLYLLAGFCAIVSYIILTYLKAPSILVTAFPAALSTIIVFMCINLWWKISLHTAIVAASVAVLAMFYGWAAATTVALVPLTAWARVELKYHSLAQAAAGAFLAALIVVVVFYQLALT
ncbi:phosphatidic acid phosphatase [Chloroflexota bacterium]